MFLTLLTLGVSTAVADSAEDFLASLRERGWHDTALEYLASAEQDPLASPSFIARIPYERATTQAALARLAPNERLRQQRMAEAAKAFEQFATSSSDSPLQIDALSSSGNIYLELALLANNKAERLPAAATGQREQLGNSAREYLSEAQKPLTELQKRCNEALESLPKAAEIQKDKSGAASRQQLEGKLAEAKFQLAKIDFESARTYEDGSKAQQQKLKSAAKAFAELYEEYGDNYLVGFLARLHEGRCYQIEGETEKALKTYRDIVEVPPIANRSFRRLVCRAYRYRSECHLLEKDFDKAIEESREWLEESSGTELTEPDWLAVSFQLANAYEAKAAADVGGDEKRLEAEARKLYREIANHPGEFQREAKAKIAAGGQGRERPTNVRTFEEAFAAGKESLEQMNSARIAVGIAKENNPGSVESLQGELAEEQLAALDFFQQALQLADSESDADDLGSSYYFLCALYWEAEKLEEAAVVGEFMARRFSEHPQAQVAAKIALAAYERMYNAAQQAGENSEFESSHLAEIAELLALRWPKSPEARAGLNLLINLALRDNRLADAEKILQQLPPASRAGAELRLGGALWIRYLRAIADDSADSTSADLKQKAGQLLSNGFQALQSSPQASASEASGVLYFAQFLLAEDRTDEAIAALENDAIGPLGLIEQKAAVAKNEAFVQQAYRVGLQAYLSTEPAQLDKAKAMMTALESAIGSGKDAQQKLINIYVGLGLQLQQQIKALTAAGKAVKARAVAEAFAVVLARVTERAGGADNWKIQSWIAQTNLQLGQGLSGDDAKEYFSRAETAYNTLLAKAEQDPKFAPSPISVLATKKKLADCYLAQGKFTEAFQQYALILKGKPNSLDLQLAAAAALQEWGEEAQEAGRLEESIRGALPQANRKNLVWGWLRIADLVERSRRSAVRKAADDPAQAAKAAKYEDLFFEARYHIAEARFEAAKLATGADRAEQLSTALNSLQSMQKLYPDLGGPKWEAAYLELMKQMEQVQ